MLNKEKYIDVIIEDMFGVCCDNRVIQMAIGECDNDIDCTTCFNKVVKWLNEEYVENNKAKELLNSPIYKKLKAKVEELEGKITAKEPNCIYQDEPLCPFCGELLDLCDWQCNCGQVLDLHNW